MAFSQPPQTEQPGTAPATTRPRRHHLLWSAAAVGVGVVLIHQSLSNPVEGLGKPVQVRTSVAPRPTGSAGGDDDKGLARSTPTRLSIPDIGVDAPFTKLSLGSSGQLEAPPLDNTNLVGWFQDGASPGERGASVVVGHVDTLSGPAVFAQLDSLETGNDVDVTRADGVVAHFKVDSVQTFSKAAFPDDEVYADTATPELRLITCGGPFNRTTKDYEDNVVVFAHLDSATHT
ncbi:class F sortase [Streptomyces sp. NPDC047017]|uniref:class F sortase n=1 Tax=Streptomyces sp. NPDC047017 TaxID=3155024 RepID=UPI0033F87DED